MTTHQSHTSRRDAANTANARALYYVCPAISRWSPAKRRTEMLPFTAAPLASDFMTLPEALRAQRATPERRVFAVGGRLVR